MVRASIGNTAFAGLRMVGMAVLLLVVPVAGARAQHPAFPPHAAQGVSFVEVAIDPDKGEPTMDTPRVSAPAPALCVDKASLRSVERRNDGLYHISLSFNAVVDSKIGYTGLVFEARSDDSPSWKEVEHGSSPITDYQHALFRRYATRYNAHGPVYLTASSLGIHTLFLRARHTCAGTFSECQIDVILREADGKLSGEVIGKPHNDVQDDFIETSCTWVLFPAWWQDETRAHWAGKHYQRTRGYWTAPTYFDTEDWGASRYTNNFYYMAEWSHNALQPLPDVHVQWMYGQASNQEVRLEAKARLYLEQHLGPQDQQAVGIIIGFGQAAWDTGHTCVIGAVGTVTNLKTNPAPLGVLPLLIGLSSSKDTRDYYEKQFRTGAHLASVASAMISSYTENQDGLAQLEDGELLGSADLSAGEYQVLLRSAYALKALAETFQRYPDMKPLVRGIFCGKLLWQVVLFCWPGARGGSAAAEGAEAASAGEVLDQLATTAAGREALEQASVETTEIVPAEKGVGEATEVAPAKDVGPAAAEMVPEGVAISKELMEPSEIFETVLKQLVAKTQSRPGKSPYKFLKNELLPRAAELNKEECVFQFPSEKALQKYVLNPGMARTIFVDDKGIRTIQRVFLKLADEERGDLITSAEVLGKAEGFEAKAQCTEQNVGACVREGGKFERTGDAWKELMSKSGMDVPIIRYTMTYYEKDASGLGTYSIGPHHELLDYLGNQVMVGKVNGVGGVPVYVVKIPPP